MGIEDFRVFLVTEQSAESAGLRLRSQGFVSDGVSDHGQHLMHFFDGAHYIEASIDDQAGPEGRTVTLRFALCNPETIDDIFSSMLEATLGWPSSLRRDSEGSVDAVRKEIAAERESWRNTFGRVTSPLSPAEAIQRFVIDT